MTAIVKAYAQPLRLYRYRSLEHFDQEMDAIEHAYLYCAAYRDLNDPMEGLFTLSDGLKRSASYRAAVKSIVDDKSGIGICSFSEMRNHELMWAHYADQFRGICVSYSFSKLLKNLPDHVRFVRIFYSEVGPTIHRSDRESRRAKKILSYKNHRWLYEREWRMLAKHGRVSYRDPACVARVYLGSRIADAHRIDIEHRLAPLGIGTRQMKIKEYSISFEPAK